MPLATNSLTLVLSESDCSRMT